MSIRFSCLCGKHLKADESHAGRRIMCPKCKRPVAIPAADEAAEPEPVRDYFAEDPFAHETRPAAPAVDPPATRSASRTKSTAPAAKKKSKKKQRKPKPAPSSPTVSTSELVIEQAAAGKTVDIGLRNAPKWHRLLSRRRGDAAVVAPSLEFEYSLGAVPLIGGICLAMTLTGGLSARMLPDALQGQTVGTFAVIATAMSIFLTAGAFACSLVGQSLANAMSGDVLEIDHDPALAVRHLVIWLASVAAGPVLPLAGTVLYWLRIGHSSPLDIIILVELSVFAVLWFLLILLKVTEENAIKAIRPANVMANLKRVPIPLLASSVGTVALLAAAFATTAGAFERIHNDDGLGFLMFGLATVGLVVGSTVNARLLGRACFRAELRRKERATDDQAEAAVERQRERLESASQRASGTA